KRSDFGARRCPPAAGSRRLPPEQWRMPSFAPERRKRAHLRVPARLRESTHDSLAAPPVTVRAAHRRFAGHSPLRSQQAACPAAVTEGALRGAVVVSGWLVRGDSWVESPPRAGYPLDDVPAPPAPQSAWLTTREAQNATLFRPLHASIFRASSAVAISSDSSFNMVRILVTCSALDFAS